MKKRRVLALVILVLTVILLPLIILALMLFVPRILNPAKRPPEKLREYILRLTPIGTSIEDAIKVVESREDLTHMRVDFERGFSPLTTTRPNIEINPGIHVIGEMAVVANMGTYRSLDSLFFLHRVDVNVFWGFDKDGNLIDVHILKIGGS